jgi:hypothetical protein
VWLLRGDGTILTRRASTEARPARPTGLRQLGFSFEPVDPKSLVALVFSLGDVVVAHPIPQTSARRETWQDDWVDRSRRPAHRGPLAWESWAVDQLRELSLDEQKDALELKLVGPFVLERMEGTRRLPAPGSVHVWILRRDGTALPRRGPINEMAPTAKGGWTWQLAFERATLEDLIAVVVRLDERLFIYEASPRG